MRRRGNRTSPDTHERLPYIEIRPVSTVDELMAFDRGVCAEGCKRFVRELTDVDFPPPITAELRQRGEMLLIVQEVRRGVRKRIPASGYVVKRRELSWN
jgi:hypothetical protein